MTQPEFDIEFPEAKHRTRGEGVAARKEAKVTDKVKWTMIRAVHRPKCDICVARMELGGRWHAPDPVMWERRGDGTLLYACYHDAAPLRLSEGLEPTP